MGIVHGEYLLYLIILSILVLLAGLISIIRYRRFCKKYGSYLYLLSIKNCYGLGRLFAAQLIVTIIVSLLGLVLLQPYIEKKEQEKITEAQEIVIIVDCSLSMLAPENRTSKISRFMKAKQAILDISSLLENDAVGLTIFSEIGIRIVPFLTKDKTLFNYYVSMLNDEFPKHLTYGSNIGDGLFEGLDSFADPKSDIKKLVIIISDGEPSDVEDDQIYNTLKLDDGIKKFNEFNNAKIFLIGVGNPAEAMLIPKERGKDGNVIEYFSDEDTGEFIFTQPKLWFLKDLADKMGGEFIDLTAGGDLKKTIGNLIESERRDAGIKEKISQENIGKYFLMVCLALLFLLPIIKTP